MGDPNDVFDDEILSEIYEVPVYFDKNIGRFMSEYGMQSFPEPKTIATFAKKKDWDIEYQVHKLGFDRIPKLHNVSRNVLRMF